MLTLQQDDSTLSIALYLTYPQPTQKVVNDTLALIEILGRHLLLSALLQASALCRRRDAVFEME